MKSINPSLKNYIENNIFPQYTDESSGHGLSHIQYVIRRSLAFAESIENININMVYTIAAYHDLGHSIDPKNHEIISAKLFLQDLNVKKFFTEDEIQTIAEAIEDHRASSNYTPRSIYGKIVSTADRSTSLSEFLSRAYQYSLKQEPNLSYVQHMERVYQHMKAKYGNCGYAKIYLKDIEFENFTAQIQNLIENKSAFQKTYQSINKKTN